MGTPNQGRLVLNHSTHIAGLIPLLERLVKHPGIATVTPGAISSVRSNAPKLQLRISVPIRGGFKVIARKGKSVQEVFILTSLEQPDLERAITTVIR